MVPELSDGLWMVLTWLRRSWEEGSTGFEVPDRELPKKSKWYNPTLRRLRLLAKRGYAEEVKSVQASYRAFRITGAGVAACDIRLLLARPTSD